MKYFRNFDVATCFEDLVQQELGENEAGLSIHRNKTKVGAFADPRFVHLRLLAYNAYYLTALLEFRNGVTSVKRFNDATLVEELAYRSEALVQRIENNRDKYPSLQRWKGQRAKKGERLIVESELLYANLLDNPQADPRAFAAFFEGIEQSIQTPAPFGALALSFYDHVIDHVKSGDIVLAFQCMYRAQSLVDAGNDVRASASKQAYVRSRSRGVATAGGEARAKKFKALEQETIRLYLAGIWDSVPSAAQDITPKIVALSRNGNGDLLPTTTKPLQWIRAYNRLKK